MITVTVKNDNIYVEIKFPCTDTYLNSKLTEIKTGNIDHTTFLINEVILPKELSFLEEHYINLDELNYLAKRMDSFFGDEETQFFEAMKLENFVKLKDLINLTFNLDKYTIIKDVSDMAKVGREYLLNTKGCIPADDEDNHKYTKIGRELLQSGSLDNCLVNISNVNVKNDKIYNMLEMLLQNDCIYELNEFTQVLNNIKDI